MNERNPRADAVALVEAAFGPKGWNFAKRQLWVDAVADLEVEAVRSGAVNLVRDWVEPSGRQPSPGHLRARALKHQRLRAQRAHHDASLNEEALADALACRQMILDGRYDLLSLDETDEQIATIRGRIAGHGEPVQVNLERIAQAMSPPVKAAMLRVTERGKGA